METTKEILIIDLEATCWEQDGDDQKQKSEIIEIGICKLNIETGKITSSEGILIKPVKSEINEFCTHLTSITPQMTDEHGITLSEACNILEKLYNSKNLTWASYGGYDRTMLKEQCSKIGIPYPMSSHHINVKVLLSDIHDLAKGIGMARALRMLHIPLEGTHHRGVDDAKNIAKILYTLIAV